MIDPYQTMGRSTTPRPKLRLQPAKLLREERRVLPGHEDQGEVLVKVYGPGPSGIARYLSGEEITANRMAAAARQRETYEPDYNHSDIGLPGNWSSLRNLPGDAPGHGPRPLDLPLAVDRLLAPRDT